jgi:energy-coupling factor transporter ATP-binding protein EcfA2
MDGINEDVNLINLPNFKLDKSKIPLIRIKKIRIQNLKGYKDYTFDFASSNGKCKSFVCFHGPNGTGKTTVLDVIQLIFSRFDNYERDRLKALLGKAVRHEDGNMGGVYGDDDFLITAELQIASWESETSSSSPRTYQVKINKTGFIQDHPNDIKEFLYRLCFYARLDQELHQFQLNRDKWPIFKELCEAVTGFEIEEKKSVFDLSEDPIQANLLKEYVLGFWVKKPHEIISHTECSAGERKIIKSFSTMLNMEYTPKIICIDNATMHVELGRHIALMNAIKTCFSDSQIFTTVHSYNISRNYGSKDQMYDLRLVVNPDMEEWQLRLLDELEDNISKLKNLTIHPEVVKAEITKGEKLLGRCKNKFNEFSLYEDVELFIKRVAHLHIIDIYSGALNNK